jgi:hypothetical protein
MMARRVVSDVDLHCDFVRKILHPRTPYHELRDVGAAIWPSGMETFFAGKR